MPWKLRLTTAMTNRVRALGGSLEVRSTQGVGTTVEGWIPARALEAAS